MPIRPENRARYPKTWKQMVTQARERSGDRHHQPHAGLAPAPVGPPRPLRTKGPNDMSEVQTIALHRWTAEITYRRDHSDEVRIASFHELYELHNIIEGGPDFYAIKSIVIGPPRHSDPVTIEQAEQS